MADKIELEPLESSNLAGAGYNKDKQILALQFKDGAIFHYAPVSLEQATDFYGAESKGRHYSQHIKGKIAGQKMTGTCPKCGDKHGWIGETCSDCGTGVYEDKGGRNAG